MFASRKNLSHQVADVVDLAIDFATLGEYGLEPVDQRSPACEGRRRAAHPRSTGAWNAAVARFAAQA